MGVSVSRRDATPCALLRKEASQRQQRRSVAPASQRQQRRSVTPASQRRSANSVAASLAQRQRRSVAPSQRHPPPGASQRRSATRPWERHSAKSETHASAPFAPALDLLIYPLKMVIFHSYVNVYQRVPILWVHWYIMYYILHRLSYTIRVSLDWSGECPAMAMIEYVECWEK